MAADHQAPLSGSELELGGLGVTTYPDATDVQQLDAKPASERALQDRQLLEDQTGAACRLAAWLAVLGAGYGFQRGLCAGGLPYDCDPFSAEEHFSTLTTLAFVGGALGWLVGVTRPSRFAWLALSPRRTACLLLTYLATFPIYGGVSNIPAMRTSLAKAGSWGTGMITLFALAAAAALAAVAFHLLLALRAGSSSSSGGGGGGGAAGAAGEWTELEQVEPRQPAASSLAGLPSTKSISSTASSSSTARLPGCQAWDSGEEGRRSSSGGGGGGRQQPQAHAGASGDVPIAPKWGSRARRWHSLGKYLLPRLAVLLYFAVWLAAMPASGAYDMHLHHFALGWGVAIWAAFNHPVSGAVLAIATAVFVQGAATYGFDPFFKPANQTGGCMPLSSETGQMSCVFWSNDPFKLDICSDTAWIPWFDCNLPWPYPGSAVNRNGSAAAAVGSKALPGTASLSPAQGPRGGPWP